MSKPFLLAGYIKNKKPNKVCVASHVIFFQVVFILLDPRRIFLGLYVPFIVLENGSSVTCIARDKAGKLPYIPYNPGIYSSLLEELGDSSKNPVQQRVPVFA